MKPAIQSTASGSCPWSATSFYGEAPRQAAANGGYASRENLRQAKVWGVRDMAFRKKSGLRIEDMVRSRVYRKVRNFRAGIEAGISCLKRAYGLARCTWRGLDHFKTYVWSSVVAYSLALFGLCASSSAKLGGHACWSCGLTECEFLVLSQVVHVDVAIGLHPVFVGFDGERADEA